MTALPPAAARLLQEAAATPIPPDNPLARVKAIEAATARIRRHYPAYFTQEQHHETETHQRTFGLPRTV